MSLPRPLRRAVLEQLRQRIRAVEGRAPAGWGESASADLSPGAAAAVEPVRSGWPGVDGVGGPGGGLPRGVLHEWLGVGDGAADGVGPEAWTDRWTPPLLLLAHLAGRALGQRVRATGSLKAHAVVWIGRRVRPYAPALAAASRDVPWGALLQRTLFVDPPDAGSRLWAVDVALRCRALAAVVADASGLRMAESRRLQLAAEAGGAFALLARPPSERFVPSAAATRWWVTRATGGASEATVPAWSLTLLRSKVGARAGHEAPEPWRLEWDHAQGVLESPRALAPALVGGARAPTSRPHASCAG